MYWYGSGSTDPDPRIRITDLRIGTLLFLSVAEKMQTKNKFFLVFCLLWYFLKAFLHQFPLEKKWKIIEIKVFLILCLLMEGFGSAQNNDGSESGRPKTIHNTDKKPLKAPIYGENERSYSSCADLLLLVVLSLLPLVLHVTLHLLKHPLRLRQALHVLHHLGQMLLGAFLLVKGPEQGGEESQQQATHDDVLQPGWQ